MFDLSGNRTQPSRLAEQLIRGTGVIGRDPLTSPVIVLYRSDPFDHLREFPFLTTMIGVTQEETMFGPMVYDDRRRTGVGGQVTRRAADNPLGFRAREGIAWSTHHEGNGWQLHISTHKGKRQPRPADVKQVIELLSDLLESNTAGSSLFPELWHRERLLADKLRRSLQSLHPGPPLDEVVRHLTEQIHDSLSPLFATSDQNQHFVGLYVRSDGAFQLLGNPRPKWLPASVHSAPDGGIHELNAFDWVQRSTRPVLIRPPRVSKVWQKRLAGCGGELRSALRSNDFAGCCIVPILDLSDSARTLALLLFQSAGTCPVNPAHMFLLSRAAHACSAYLTPLQAAPGFGLWSVGRGRATVRVKRRTRDPLETLVEQIASELMPSDARVTVEQVRAGRSGASVYRLEVHRQKMEEIPRILKLDDEDRLEAELKLYYKYVHNTRVGGSARLDIARRRQDMKGKSWGAAVYTFVGAGNVAEPWTVWGQRVSRGELTQGVEQLREQFACWFNNRQPVAGSPVQNLIREPLLEENTVNAVGKQRLRNPDWTAVRRYLERFCADLEERRAVSRTQSCTVHGDLHCGNVFALRESGGGRVTPAVIDWGSVSDTWHPLTDVARLIVDLEFKVRWPRVDWEAEWKWGTGMVDAWAKEIGSSVVEARLALMHQIVRFMFYPSDGGSYLRPHARQEAWSVLKKLGADCVDGRKR